MREKKSKPKKYRQNREVASHFHPRRLARAVVHNRVEHGGATGVNKVRPGTTQSAFAQNWRSEAEAFAAK